MLVQFIASWYDNDNGGCRSDNMLTVTVAHNDRDRNSRDYERFQHIYEHGHLAIDVIYGYDDS